MNLMTTKKRFSVRKEIQKFSYLPIFYRGVIYWLSRVKIEKTFNGMRMRIVNIQKV